MTKREKRKLPSYTRNPIYIFYAIGALFILLFASLIAASPGVGAFERAVFFLFYDLPLGLKSIFAAIAIFGTIISILVIIGGLLFYRRRDILLRVGLASLSSYFITQVMVGWVSRARPVQLLSDVSPRIQIDGFGFPSALAAVLFATGLTLSAYSPRAFRRWILYTTLMLSCAGLFLGVNLPLDIAAGWAVGLLCYSLTLLAIGSLYRPVDAKKLASKLKLAGMVNAELEPANVDARGSVPFFGKYEGGKIFVKVFNRDNNAADWLFKLIRRVQFRRLEDEVPSLSPKRAIEHEAYLTMLAKYNAKARVPEVLGIYRVGTNSYAMAIAKIDSTGLDKLAKNKTSDKLLVNVWKEIVKLHNHRIIHKDLRAANIMVEDRTGLPWLIDFGFSECAISPKSYYKDNVEFIASSATRVGARRAVAAAISVLGKKEIENALPYMQYAALSGATTTELKKKPALIEELRSEMIKMAEVKDQDIRKAKLNRISIPKRFN